MNYQQTTRRNAAARLLGCKPEEVSEDWYMQGANVDIPKEVYKGAYYESKVSGETIDRLYTLEDYQKVYVFHHPSISHNVILQRMVKRVGSMYEGYSEQHRSIKVATGQEIIIVPMKGNSKDYTFKRIPDMLSRFLK